MSANPFTIPIGTSQPPLNLCHGLPLFPGLGTARAGVSAVSRSYPVIDVSATIAITRLNVSVYALFGFGVCGPAIAFLSREVDVLRLNQGDKGELELTFNEGLMMQAGAFMGAYAGAGVTLTLHVYLPKPWYKVWAATWREAFAFNKDFKLDLLKLLFALIRYLLSKSSKNLFTEDTQNRLKDAVPFVQTFSLLDTAGSSIMVKPNLTATPNLTLPINVANYFPSLKAINDSLSKVGGEISVGPSIGLDFPVTLKNFDHFTVFGGLAGAAKSANYGKVIYDDDKRVSATGNTQFDPGKRPSRVTTYVNYGTTFKIALSLHFRLTVAKFFNIGANTPSLDLTYLLYRIRASDRTVSDTKPVSTDVENGCVLTPNMTLAFTGSASNGANFVTGETLKGTVNLPGFRSPTATDVNLKIEPQVAGFPAKVTIPANSQTASFNFIFKNQCLATGNLNHPFETAPPSPLSPLQTYNVSAALVSASSNLCSDYEVEVPLNIAERVIRFQRMTPADFATPGTPPPWDETRLAGATINADPSRGGEGRLHGASISLWFPYLPGEATATSVPVTFTLLDENRQPHATSDVVLGSNQGLVPLKPSATLALTLPKAYRDAIYALIWNSKGPYTGYSNRFYLIVNAGCQYGQTEFWLDVWNWS